MKVTVKLTRPAAKGGGDRYETKIQGEQKPWVVYIPQQFSRVDGEPKRELDITIE